MTSLGNNTHASTTPRKRPRIGVDFHTFDGIFQGSRSHLLGLYREAITLAPDIDFILLLADPARLVREHPEFDAPNVRRVTMRALPGALRMSLQLSWHQIRQRLDLLHVQYRLPLVPLGPCACTIHDVLFETHPQYFTPGFIRMSRATSRFAVARSDPLFTVSEFSRSAMVTAYGLNPENISVTPNAVDLNQFEPADTAAAQRGIVPAKYGLVSGNYLCTLGRLEPRKNHLALIRAYAALSADPTLPPLAIIGQRDFGFEAIYQEVERLGITSLVRFLDNVDDADLPAMLREARLFIYPSWAEGFGMPVLEAMASGVPVITSTATSMPEVAGDAARLVKPEDTRDLTEAIAELLSASDGTRELMIERGLRQARRFSWRASATVLVDQFRERLARGRR